ncbi:unnamed protein product [Staurois parvus]|uniref:Uncharacterized protein n=1 Tax=Staurois parvus TaxID=386267 RepID=A0ABN9HBJ5_9NEOB|nr:unnamed protein product [Staurois parvus]
MVGMDLTQPETRSQPSSYPSCGVQLAGSITTEQTVLDGKQRILRSRAGFSNGRSGKGLKQ